MRRHVHLLLSLFLFLLCCLAVRPIEFKSCLLFWDFTLHSRIDHYFTAWVLLIITVWHSSEIQSITETYDHFITGTLFFSCSWSQRQKYAWRMQSAYLELQNDYTKSRTDWAGQSLQQTLRVFCVVLLQSTQTSVSHPSGLEFVPQTSRLFLPHQHKAKLLQAPEVTGDPIREDPNVLPRYADWDKADTEQQYNYG